MQYNGPYSVSSLEQFETCPKQFAFARIDLLPQGAGTERDVGSAIHSLLERYAKHLLAKGWATDPDAFEQFAIEVEGDAALSVDGIIDFRSMLPKLAAYELPRNVTDVEVEGSYALDRDWKPVEWSNPAARFRGRIDLTYRQGGLVVVDDYKSGRRILGQSEVENSLQLRTYGWVKLQDAEEILIRFLYVRYGAERKALVRKEALADVPRDLERRMAKIDAERDFDARLSPLCHWCAWRNQCPAFAAVYADGVLPQITSAEAAQTAAMRLVALEALAKDLKEQLRAWVDVNGTVAAGDRNYGYETSEKLVFDDVRALGSALVEVGYPRERLLEVFNATKTSVEKALRGIGFKGKSFKEAWEKIEAAASRDVQTKIGMRRAS